jgi:1-acyl-sn-glycerol-3-phosphate acyltransferase
MQKWPPMLTIIRIPLLILWIALCAIWGILIGLCRPFDPRNVHSMTNVLKHGLKIVGVEVEVRNRSSMNQHLPCVFISNHQDNFDIFIGASAIPERTVSIGKRNIIYIPIFGLFYWLSGNILIDRKNKRSAFDTMDDVAKSIKGKNISVWIMPEGTRSRGRGLLPFKKGPFITAVKADVPIIPVAVSNYVGKLNFNKWNAGKIIIEILPAISTAGKTIEDAVMLKDLAHKALKDTIDNLDAELAKPLS